MSDRGRQSWSTRMLCVNCNICVNTLRRYKVLTLNPRAAGILCNWVYPQIVSEDDHVCEACRDLAMSAVNENLQQVSDNAQAGPSQQGHSSVCLLCGCSTLRRRSERILRTDASELLQSMISIIESRVAPRQVTETDRVCYACWSRVQREARRRSTVDDARNQYPTISQAPQEKPQSSDIPPQEEPEISQPVPQEEESQSDAIVTSNNCITLPNYRRAANTNHHCVFPNCGSVSLHSINNKMRALILSNHKYYLPKEARICAEHLMGNMWETLFDSQNSYSSFTAQHVQHIFSFVNVHQQLDFENIEDME